MLKIKNIPVDEIYPDEDFNCRGIIAPIDVVDLANNIKENGLMQPITVVPYTGENGCKYKLIAGYRRHKAHIINKATKIQAVIRDDIKDDVTQIILNISENVERQDLSILEEARAINKLRERGLAEDTVSRKIGKSRGWVQIRYMLLALPDDIQQEIATGLVTQTQIRELYTMYNKYGRDPVVDAIKKLKDSKMLGRKAKIKDERAEKEIKKPQGRDAIWLMQDRIIDAFGTGIHSKALAWAAGEINTIDLEKYLLQAARDKGVLFQ